MDLANVSVDHFHKLQRANGFKAIMELNEKMEVIQFGSDIASLHLWATEDLLFLDGARIH